MVVAVALVGAVALVAAIAAVIAVAASYAVYSVLSGPLALIVFMRAVQLGVGVLVAIAVYVGLLKAFRVEEISVLKEIIHR